MHGSTALLRYGIFRSSSPVSIKMNRRHGRGKEGQGLPWSVYQLLACVSSSECQANCEFRKPKHRSQPFLTANSCPRCGHATSLGDLDVPTLLFRAIVSVPGLVG